jgi:hypothetical protein
MKAKWEKKNDEIKKQEGETQNSQFFSIKKLYTLPDTG